jgi:ribosomal protein L34E
MGELINLRRVKKSKRRNEIEKCAAANRVVHGTPKELREAAEAEKRRAERTLGAHRIENKN